MSTSTTTTNSNKRKKSEKTTTPVTTQHEHEHDHDEEEEEQSMDLETLKQQFMALESMVSESDRIKFISFVCEHLDINIQDTDHNPFDDESQEDAIMATIVQDIKDVLPSINALSASENDKIVIPNNDSFKGYTKENTINVDSFLYTDEDIDELVESGKLKDHYCLDCSSTNVTQMIQLKYIFSEEVLGDLKDKVMLDIGSRLGAVLYAGFLYSGAKQLVGIEIDDELVSGADVIFINNALEFFEADISKHVAFWRRLRELTEGRKGVRFVTIPAIQDTFKNNKLGLSIKGWLREVHLHMPSHQDDKDFEDYKEIHLYEVIGTGAGAATGNTSKQQQTKKKTK
ncbi:hypothetical protein SAMD00019534_050990 [Acytostelium subglobosum LB1]|uniref:hypothetical protein n=1 Tax=Acytostelium subglobosum LB1 TaxID=1410327 RepID=UPI00064517B4|nr:hypothetical protein SAMD00019534_050990 [Acytostelium subglobosum LB1]GAM21924.1 hypothetical protein SAMD00019534_050990 [Acytostelium subglobosum LB1]|eukprot:XP_012755024.1 hypothetical protein SAMD00019534_050990 [Acytostelium subglobosum LB1]